MDNLIAIKIGVIFLQLAAIVWMIWNIVKSHREHKRKMAEMDADFARTRALFEESSRRIAQATRTFQLGNTETPPNLEVTAIAPADFISISFTFNLSPKVSWEISGFAKR